MSELSRPAPAAGRRDRVHDALAFIGLGRLIAAAVSVMLVAAGAWWLLRTPPPPVERTLPVASGSASRRNGASPTTASVGSGAGRGAAGASDSGTGPAGTGSANQSANPSGNPSAAGTVVVQAVGAVAHPGVYTLPAGSRIVALIAAAGGPVDGANPDALALAAVLQDGDRVEVPIVGQVVAGPAPSGQDTASAPSRARPIDLNRATADQLDQLPGIGPATAAAIVAHRSDHGPYSSVDGLLDVKGIGPAKLDAIRALVRV